MKQKLYSTREAEKLIGIQGTCPQNVRIAFNRSVKRLGFTPVGTRPREGATKGGTPENLWSEEQIIAIYEDYWTHCKNPSAKKPLVFDVVAPVGDSDKKIMPATAATGQETNANNHADDTTNHGVTQQLGNLPAEIVSQKRFFATDDKGSPPSGWSTPANQKLAAEVFGKRKFIGFDISGHGQGTDYALIDFDHVRNPVTGAFVCPAAEQWFNYVKLTFDGCYCELSQSGEGFHFLCRPTAGKFGMVTNKEGKGILYFDKATNAKVEIFYKNAARYCMLTGNLFDCAAGAPVADEVASDEVLSNLLSAIVPPAQATEEPEKPHAEISPDFQRLVESIKAITPAQLAAKGYLQRSEKGAPHPTGYICPWCGSGTHVHKTGALTFYETPNPHFACHACSSGGDVIKLLSKIYGIDNRGKDYFTLIRKAADDFCLPYEPAIFDFKPAPLEPPAEDNFVRTQDRIKSCPVNLRLPSNYLFGTNGIELVVPAKKENADPKYIFVATPIVPVKSFRDALKGTVVYEIAILDKGKWRTTEVEGRTLSDPRAALDFANFGASIDEPKYLCKFFTAIKLINQDLLELKAYNQTGWTTEDYDDFALPVDDKSIVRRPGYDYERIFKPRGDREAWKNKFVEITEQGGAVAKTIIGTCCAAPLVRPLKLLNLQVHLHGTRSAGKTPLLKFGVSIYGDANVGALAYTFSATPKSRLETAAAFRDLPVIGEELESLSAREAEHLPQDIYNYALGIGGQALQKDGTRRDPKLFSGARLTSGEHPLVQGNGNGGEFKRVLELRCGQLLDVDFAADLHGFCDDNRGLFGEQWIRYVVKHRATIAKHYHKALETVKARQRSSAKANDDTQLATLVISAVAYQHFKICLGLQEVGNDKELEATLNAIIFTLPTVDEIDDSQRAIEFLQSFVAGNEKSFVHMVRDTGTGRLIDVAQYNAECYGKIYPDGRVAFLPHALKKILQGQGGFKSADKLIAEFADQGKIEVSLLKENPLGYAKICGCTKRAYIFKSCVVHDSDSELSESDESAV